MILVIILNLVIKKRKKSKTKQFYDKMKLIKIVNVTWKFASYCKNWFFVIRFLNYWLYRPKTFLDVSYFQS